MELIKDELTEGELVIEQYLKDEGYSYEVQKEISGLIGDTKRSFRKADFYLKKYEVYIEFLGMWNKSEIHRTEYKEKMKIYAANNIACVYLWPDNLGFIKQALNYRIEKELRAKNKLKQLARFKRFQLNRNTYNFQLIWLTLLGFLYLWLTRNNNNEWPVAIREGILFSMSVMMFFLTVYLLLALYYSLLIRLGLDKKYGKGLEEILKM